MKKVQLSIFSLVFLMVFTVGSDAAQAQLFKRKRQPENTEKQDSIPKKSKYEEFFKEPHETVAGMFTLHLMKEKLYFEVPLELFGREMLIGSTISQISDNNNAIVGSKPTDPLHVVFTRNETHVQLREIRNVYQTSDHGIDVALQASNIAAILKNAKIETFNEDSTAIVFEMTDFFVSDNKKMSPFDRNSNYGAYKRTESFKSDRSYVSGIKAFSDNVSIRSTLSYTYDLSHPSTGQSLLREQPFTAELTRSIILLAETPYRPRMADYRIGVFFTERTRLGVDSETTAPVFYANRWQLVPSDTAAFRRGEKVRPVKPIVFYIDSTFPEQWKPYIREGVNQWQEVFEEIGFKDAIYALDFPEDDPEFDPDNLKYSCLRYAPIGIQNAMGPSWVDPRSGEILTASVYVYHDVVKLINNWLFVQTSQADADVRRVQAPESVVGDALRYVLAHEIGHCLGFMHNMGASSVIPVDSLRSPSFTQQHGTTMSIMDYARFNYVAQPGDKEKGVRLTPPRFGEYDRYLVRWTYTPLLDAQSVEEDARITGQWISEAIKNPIYRYGKQQFSRMDPRSLSEDLGDDAVAATRYGVQNLKYIVANFDGWITEGDENFEFRNATLLGIINQLAMYITHVQTNVGGVYINEIKQGDDFPPFENMPTDKQVRALKYLFELYGDLAWLNNETYMSKLPLLGSPRDVVENFLSDVIVTIPFQVSAYADISHRSFSFREAADMVYNYVWGPTLNGRKPTASQLYLQRKYVERMMSAGSFEIPGRRSSSLALSSDHLGHDRQYLTSHQYCCGQAHEEEPLIPGEFAFNPVGGFEWSPRAIFHRGQATRADVYAYLSRARALLKEKSYSVPADVRAHYELLINTIDLGLK